MWRKTERRFFEAAEFSPERLVEARQVHGSDVLAAEEISPHEKASGDALITNDSPPGAGHSDCGLRSCSHCDSRKMAIAAVHAGRKGVAGGILMKTVERMKENYGCDSRDLRVAVGPRHLRKFL